MAAANRNSLNLQHASADLRDDKEVDMTAVRTWGRALTFASSRLQSDREVVMTALRDHDVALVEKRDDIEKRRRTRRECRLLFQGRADSL